MTQLTALFLTLLFEGTVLMVWWATMDRGRSPKRYAMACVAASCMTHPIAWWVNVTIGHSVAKWTRLGTIEIIVVACEALLYTYALPLSWRRGIVLSLLANALSFGAGLLIFKYWLD